MQIIDGGLDGFEFREAIGKLSLWRKGCQSTTFEK
jgi:hypothetical protein